jgi:hypothetical protein
MKKRPNPAYQGPKSPKQPRKRTRSRANHGEITVYQIHCKACSKRYELAYTGEVKFCVYCSSDQIEKSLRRRKETPVERAQRKMEFNLRFASIVGNVISSLFGPGPFQQQPPFQPPPRNGKPSALEAELLKEGYRKLAVKYHPDKGGDPEKMKELNRLKEKLGL